MHLAIGVLNEVQNLCLKFAVVDSLGPRYRCGIGSVQHIELLVRPKEGIKRTAGCTSQWIHLIQQSQESYLSGTTVQISREMFHQYMRRTKSVPSEL